jgi:hypothetical protein
MLEEIVPILKNFRDRIYHFFPSRRDAAMELIDALSSNKAANSVVALSLSPLHRRNYCSITRVLVSRARNNKKFFYPYVPDEEADTPKRGRPNIYGAVHQLNDSTTWREPDDSVAFSQKSALGKIHLIKVDCWNKVIMRGKKGISLSDYPLRLLRVQVHKESGELLFKKPLWLTAAGTRRMELSLSDIFLSYRQRFDIEHFFRFGKTRLLMNKIQTPDVRHEEAWWQLVMIAYTQLYLSRSIADILPNPWEKHLPSFKTNEIIKQPTIVQKDFERIIRMIGTPAQPPKVRKNALGRQVGDIQVKRICHPIVKKKEKYGFY